jgi:hypothetical protein
MRHLIADFDAGPKSASGKSVAARHKCARIPFPSFPAASGVAENTPLKALHLDLWRCAEIYSFCAEGLCRGAREIS